MRRAPLLVCAVAMVSAPGTSPALADDAGTPLSCGVFETRLEQTIRDMGSPVPPPGPLALDYGGEDSTRYTWHTTVGLAGTLTCGKTDAFEDFGISIADAVRTSDDLPIVLARFEDMAAASVCALSEAAPQACRSLAKEMATASLAQFKDALNKGEGVPIGSRDFFIVDGVDAELYMSPVGISWSIGPGQAATMGQRKQPLAPKNVDR